MNWKALAGLGLPVLLAAAPAHPQLLTISTIAEENAASVEQLALRTPDIRDGQEICQAEAQWMRLGLRELDLRGDDELLVSSDTGDSQLLRGQAYAGRSFHLRALRGKCLRLTPRLADPASRLEIDGYQFGRQALEKSTLVVAAAGDICGSCTQTANIVEAMNPAAVIVAGDLAYESGTLAEFQQNYAPHWGRFKSRTYPVPGNHEYNTSGAKGYFDYFNGSGQFSGRAGDRDKGYYSVDVGDWHLVALNSNLPMSANSPQEQWLRRDLAATAKPCTLAYFHHPLFTRGAHDNANATRPLWRALYEHRADIVLVGHDHSYQRFAPQTPDGVADARNGIRQFLVGSGGATPRTFTRSMPNFEAGSDNTRGVLKLSLSSDGYAWQFVGVPGSSYSDSGSASCHRAPPPPPQCGLQNVSANTHEGTNVPANAVDNNLATRWSAPGPDAQLTLDHARPVVFSGVDVAWHQGDLRRSDFRVAVSLDGLNFQQVYAGRSSGSTLARERYSFAPVQARYLRLSVDGNSLNHWASVTEIAAQAECAACDFRSVEASAAEAVNPAAHAIDGKLDTRWSSLGIGQWLSGDLGSPTPVSGVRVAWHLGDERSSRFSVLASSDGQNWREVYQGSSSGRTRDAETYAFAATTARYLRLRVNGNTQNEWASVSEYGAQTQCSAAPADVR